LSGRNVEVIILDTGISMSHTQFGHLKAKISAKATGIATESAKDDGNGHGTHVARCGQHARRSL
jgi:subtilisin family serine protease